MAGVLLTTALTLWSLGDLERALKPEATGPFSAAPTLSLSLEEWVGMLNRWRGPPPAAVSATREEADDQAGGRTSLSRQAPAHRFQTSPFNSLTQEPAAACFTHKVLLEPSHAHPFLLAHDVLEMSREVVGCLGSGVGSSLAWADTIVLSHIEGWL